MDALGLLLHVLNFLAPAAFAAALITVPHAFFGSNRPAAGVITSWFAIIFALSVATLVAGLLLLGHDGRVWTYVALVLVAATARWGLGTWHRRHGGSG